MGRGILKFLKGSCSHSVVFEPATTTSLGNFSEMVILCSHPDQLKQKLWQWGLVIHMDQMPTKGRGLVKAQVDGPHT